jgi:hypothetical protein
MSKRTFYILDSEGQIEQSIPAIRKRIFHGVTGEWWVLDSVYDTDQTMSFPITFSIVDSTGWLDPKRPFKDKVMKGCEEEFDFFLKNGYHNGRRGV